jgi:hypothetical protein
VNVHGGPYEFQVVQAFVAIHISQGHQLLQHVTQRTL